MRRGIVTLPALLLALALALSPGIPGQPIASAPVMLGNVPGARLLFADGHEELRALTVCGHCKASAALAPPPGVYPWGVWDAWQAGWRDSDCLAGPQGGCTPAPFPSPPCYAAVAGQLQLAPGFAALEAGTGAPITSAQPIVAPVGCGQRDGWFADIWDVRAWPPRFVARVALLAECSGCVAGT